MLKNLAVVAFATLASTDLSFASVDRPPQYVLMAFDNCTELSTWDKLEKFLKTNPHIHFTFFVSGVNFLATKHSSLYTGPHHQPGSSNIDFGGSEDDVRRRAAYINRLVSGGNEIGSHAVGHFHGGTGGEEDENWIETDWLNEFSQYNQLLANIGSNNRLSDTKLDLTPIKVKGFRAPYLSNNLALYKALLSSGFQYDTSGTGEPSQWPSQVAGIWRFNLANVTIFGTTDKTLSMDYNFFVHQSKTIDVPKNFAFYRQQMFDTYFRYFAENYFGNRAPVHIGHHFAQYQGGVYTDALLAFATHVCNLPEVKCVTYSELRGFLAGVDSATLRAYQQGDFPRQELASFDSTIKIPQSRKLPRLTLKANNNRQLAVGLENATLEERRTQPEWIVVGRNMGRHRVLNLASRKPVRKSIKVRVHARSTETLEQTWDVLLTRSRIKVMPTETE